MRVLTPSLDFAVKQICEFYRTNNFTPELLSIFSKSNAANFPTVRDPLELLEILSGINQGYSEEERTRFTKTFLALAQEANRLDPRSLAYGFLLHGTKFKDPNQAIPKMPENLKTLQTGRDFQEQLIALGFSIPLGDLDVINMGTSLKDFRRTEKLYLNLSSVPSYDLAGAVVLRLYSSSATHTCQFLAQSAIVLNPEVGNLYILNLQGPTSRETVAHLTSGGLHMGREYARWQNNLQVSPRQQLLRVIEKIADFLDCPNLKAIRPEHHPYSYNTHQGFNPTYQTEFIKQGISLADVREPEVYFNKNVKLC